MDTWTRLRPVVTLAAARTAIEAALEEADRIGIKVAIAVLDPGGSDVAFAAMDGSPLLSRDIARGKAWTAISFGQPTRWWAEAIASEPSLAAIGASTRLLPLPGGVPLLVDGAIAGGIGVSGGPAKQDEEVAEAALAVITSS